VFDPTPILTGDRRALARLITKIENAAPEAAEALPALFPHTGRAHLIGITGPPGSGKSSLVNELAKTLRQAGRTVAIVAVDPSSPFTGGAILGDRIRMRDLYGDPGVFVRSMASRGSLGGLARATADVVKVLDAAGFDVVLVETVGAGQAEVDIARAAHTTVVIEAPGLGDDVQAIKAGLLEVADLLVVNKADQPGAESAVRALKASLELAHPTRRLWEDNGHHRDRDRDDMFPLPPIAPGLKKDFKRLPPTAVEAPATDVFFWLPPVLQTVATQGKGFAELLAALDQHRAYLQTSGELQRREQTRFTHEFEARLREVLLAAARARLGDQSFATMLARIIARQIDPTSAARELLGRVQTV